MLRTPRRSTFLRRLVLIAGVCVAGVAAACGGDDNAPTGPSDPTQDTFAAALGVDLSAMQQVAARLYVQDVTVGTGAPAADGQRLSVRYTGWLPNGSSFDSNANGPAFSFRLGRGEVISGWDIGVAGMRVGGKRRLVFGSAYGYGARGAGSIPPHSTLVFDVELLGIQ